MSDYTPNFGDPRVAKRVRSAIGFTNALLNDKPKQLYTRFIDKHFGSSNHKLSSFLRKHLLICVDDHYDMKNGLCKSYIRNRRGARWLSEQIDLTPTPSTTGVAQIDLGKDWVQNTWISQIASGEFEYEERSHRLCSPLQSVRTSVRESVFADNGYNYNYDISTAAPTIIYQYYQKCNSYYGLVLETVEHYIDNKADVRQKLCTDADLEPGVVKKILNGLFNGAKLSVHYNTQLFRLIGYDIAKMRYLQQHPYLSALRADISEMWSVIKVDQPKSYYTDKFNKDGSPRKRQFGSKHKWNLYFRLERQILNAMRTYLQSSDCRYFLEHDGFRTTVQINTSAMSSYIYTNTGYNLQLTEKCYTSSRIHSIVNKKSNVSKKTLKKPKKTITNDTYI